MPTVLFLRSANGNGGVSDTVNDMAAMHNQIILALIAIVATAVAALVYTIKANTNIKVAAEQATQANAAVNNVGPGEHRLFDKVSHISEAVERLEKKQEDFDHKGWANGLGSDIDTAPKLTDTIRKLQAMDHEAILAKLDALDAAIQDHVAWEMSQKYHEPEVS